MALFTETEIRSRGKAEVRNNFSKTASRILNESTNQFRDYKTYDIFISHSFQDSELILGVKSTLEDYGYSTYVDWINDPQLDRSKVNKETAERIKTRLSSSKSLFYVTTENSKHSKWMPWECGYFDGFKNKVAILPLSSKKKYHFLGQEYLSLYPYCDKANNTSGVEKLWIYKDISHYTSFDNWLRTKDHLITWKT